MAITAMVAMEPISEMTMTITLAMAMAMAMVITMAMVFSIGTTTMAVIAMVAMEPMSENHSKFNPRHMSSDNATYILLTQYYYK